jgi:VCBS repeat protein
VVLGCANRRLYCLDGNGKLKWDLAPPARTYARPHYRGVAPFQGAIKRVCLADLDGDGRPEIVVGAGNWRTYCYSGAGKLLWDECNWAHQPTCLATFDLDGDGVKEVVAGNDYYFAWVFDGKTGKIRRSLRMTPHAGPSAVAADDVNGDGKGDVVLGDRAGVIRFFFPWTTSLGSVNVGAPVTVVRMADLDGDKAKETIVGSANSYVYVFGPDAKLKWKKHVGETPRDILVDDVDGDGRPEVLVGADDQRLHVYGADGRDRGSFVARGAVRHVARMGSTLVIATDDGAVTLLEP